MTPCLSALKDWRPNLQIIAVLEPLAAPLLDGHPLVDRMIVVEKNAASRLAAIRTLRNSRPQIAFNLHGGTTAMLMASLCGARYSVGYDSLPGSWMANRRAPGPDKVLGRQKIHSVEQQLALLTWAGVPLPVKPRLNIEVSRPASERALAALKTINIDRSDGNSHNKAERFALIAPGAAFESKRWGASGFAAVIDYLAEHWSLRSLIVTGPGQKELAEDVAAQTRSGPLVLPHLKLDEVVALTAELGAVFVGNDSGLMHIAAAVGCPIVAVFGSSNPDVWHPWTDSPTSVLGGERLQKDTDVKGSIVRISTNEVIAAVEEVLRKVGSRQ